MARPDLHINCSTNFGVRRKAGASWLVVLRFDAGCYCQTFTTFAAVGWFVDAHKF